MSSNNKKDSAQMFKLRHQYSKLVSNYNNVKKSNSQQSIDNIDMKDSMRDPQAEKKYCKVSIRRPKDANDKNQIKAKSNSLICSSRAPKQVESYFERMEQMQKKKEAKMQKLKEQSEIEYSKANKHMPKISRKSSELVKSGKVPKTFLERSDKFLKIRDYKIKSKEYELEQKRLLEDGVVYRYEKDKEILRHSALDFNPDLLSEWDRRRKEKIEYLRNQSEQQSLIGCTFRPKIDGVSDQLARSILRDNSGYNYILKRKNSIETDGDDLESHNISEILKRKKTFNNTPSRVDDTHNQSRSILSDTKNRSKNYDNETSKSSAHFSSLKNKLKYKMIEEEYLENQRKRKEVEYKLETEDNSNRKRVDIKQGINDKSKSQDRALTDLSKDKKISTSIELNSALSAKIQSEKEVYKKATLNANNSGSSRLLGKATQFFSSLTNNKARESSKLQSKNRINTSLNNIERRNSSDYSRENEKKEIDENKLSASEYKFDDNDSKMVSAKESKLIQELLSNYYLRGAKEK